MSSTHSNQGAVIVQSFVVNKVTIFPFALISIFETKKKRKVPGPRTGRMWKERCRRLVASARTRQGESWAGELSRLPSLPLYTGLWLTNSDSCRTATSAQNVRLGLYGADGGDVAGGEGGWQQSVTVSLSAVSLRRPGEGMVSLRREKEPPTGGDVDPNSCRWKALNIWVQCRPEVSPEAGFQLSGLMELLILRTQQLWPHKNWPLTILKCPINWEFTHLSYPCKQKRGEKLKPKKISELHVL